MMFNFVNVQLTGRKYAELIQRWLSDELKGIQEQRVRYEENAKKPKPRYILPGWVRSLVGFNDYHNSIEREYDWLQDREMVFEEYRRRRDFAFKNPEAIFTIDENALDRLDAMPWPETPGETY